MNKKSRGIPYESTPCEVQVYGNFVGAGLAIFFLTILLSYIFWPFVGIFFKH